jgi:hypothetical protein
MFLTPSIYRRCSSFVAGIEVANARPCLQQWIHHIQQRTAGKQRNHGRGKEEKKKEKRKEETKQAKGTVTRSKTERQRRRMALATSSRRS